MTSTKQARELRIGRAMQEVQDEYNHAILIFPEFNSAHEGFAIILEEVDELKAEIWKNHKARSIETMRKEAKQIAAMALRFMVDLT